MVATSKACEARWDLELSAEPSRESVEKGMSHTQAQEKGDNGTTVARNAAEVDAAKPKYFTTVPHEIHTHICIP